MSEKLLIEPARGMLNQAAEDKWKAGTGRELDKRELRLLPFIHYSVLNGGVIETNRLNYEEIAVLAELNDAGLIIFRRKHGDMGRHIIGVTSAFWQVMNDILWLTYAVKVDE